jgi:hypothetical protein
LFNFPLSTLSAFFEVRGHFVQLALSTLSVANLTLFPMVVEERARSRGGRLKALESGNRGGGVSFNNNNR